MVKSKGKSLYRCEACGATFGKWMGQCPQCNAWNSLVEERTERAARPTRPGSDSTGNIAARTPSKVIPIGEIATENYARIRTQLSELDTVLGGGLVPGSAILLGGEPGVGKSTLLLQAAQEYAVQELRVLYVSGEESASQIGLRAERLGVTSPNLWVVAEAELEKIHEHIQKLDPHVLVLDSVQTVFSQELESQPGSVGQLRECTFDIIQTAKARGMAAYLVGHVTKDGAIAGPKILEHMVDVVLYFESTASQTHRLLRSIKNRFGSTNELGVFEMVAKGIRAVENPSELFLSERPRTTPGSVIGASLEGTRALLVEVQALVSTSALAMPRRTAIGLDNNRAALLVAILEKRGGMRLYDQDVYVNMTGGFRVSETALDLAVIAALRSSFAGVLTDPHTLFFGEVGLGGEVRSVSRASERLREGHRIGLKRAILPKKAAIELKKDCPLEIYGIEHIEELADLL